MKILGLITAKCDSTRIRYKNKTILHGRPLYTWTTKFLADNYEYFEDIGFSSDRPWDFRLYSGWLMIKRPKALIQDDAPHILSVIQGLEIAEKVTGKQYDAVMLFQPTNPIRKSGLLDHAIALANHHKATEKSYMSRCVYVDKNLSKQYMVGAKWDKKEGGPTIKSGALYLYSRQYLDKATTTPTACQEMRMVIPKTMGYNLNDSDDIGVIEHFMRQEGVPYGYKRVYFT